MDQRYRIAAEDWIEFEEEQHQVTGLTGALVRLRSISGHHQTIMLSVLLTDPSFRALAAPPETVDNTAAGLDPGGVLATLKDKRARDDALELEAQLQEATTGYRSGSQFDAAPGEPRPQYDPGLPLTERVVTKAGELGLTERRIWQMLGAWEEKGLWGLVDGRKARLKNPLRNIDERVITAIREQAAVERLDSSSSVSTRFQRRCQNRLDADHGAGAVPLPKPDTFRRVVKLLLHRSPSDPAYQRISDAGQPDRTFGHVIAHRPGQVVMLDTTPLDVLAYDPATNDTYNIELTVAIDVATRSILAWRLTPLGTKAIDIGLLLADIMTPEPMRPKWADALRYQMLRIPYERHLSVDERLAEAAARPVVYPETLLYDHGKPYKSDVVKRACRKWKIDLQDARKLKATDKPQVERLFLTIREKFSMHVAGYKGFNVAHRGRRVEQQARWTLDEIGEFFAEYVIAVYQNQHHRGLHLHGFPALHVSPNEAYAMALGSAGYVDCPRDPNLYYELLPIADNGRVINPYGVELNYLVYDAPVLYQFRRAKSPYDNGLWPIRYDPRNLLHAYFHNPRDNTWHTLGWTQALSDLQPFTDITLREAKRLVELRGGEPKDKEYQEQIAEALRDLQNRIDAPETWTKSDRKRHTRDRHRADAQAQDEARSAPAAPAPPPRPVPPAAKPTVPALHAVPDLSCEDDDFNPHAVQPAEVWSPRTSQEG
ncbi:DDE-type integrase/transposase/recombinase [Streptomyces sp. SM13]|uniref:DDE-type integrase/transposase/recombinase n=1 Tax=Streptomyces sp. SM13 TaxID=1983803 RepID=UPI000CD58A05|nr:DDE-type integrase/transposase/recombinase [Streptomyces sp. SM13]